MRLTDELAPWEAKFLDWEYQSSEPYMSFVYPSREQSLEINQYLLQQRACEFAPPYGRMALDEQDQPVGMIAWMPGGALQRARLQATMALTRVPLLRSDPAIGQRLRLASGTLMKVAKDDIYLSRITVERAQRQHGIGQWLMSALVRDAVACGAGRIVLEVAAHLEPTIRFYQRHHFTEIDRRRVTDEPSGRSLEYVHMQCTLNPAGQVA